MVDDVRDITETAESKEALDRARLARERREAEQRKRLDELRAHAAAAQAQREKRDEDRRKRQADQRARDDDRRQQVEERKRAIWEASISRREALLQRERDRSERLERARAARSSPRPAFAFGSSTPRLLEPLDSGGFFWAARSTNPIDQMNFFESLAASTTNVMFASAPLTRRASALHLDTSDTDNKDEPDRQPQPVMWSSVARRRTDLVPTLPAPRAPGRAYSMTRLDRIPGSGSSPGSGSAQRALHSTSPSLHHLNRTQTRSGDTTPGSRPGSALSNATGVVRRPASAPRKPRPASIAGTGVNTPRGGGDTAALSVATTPSVSRDSTMVASVGVGVGGGDVPPAAPRRAASTPRRPRPASIHGIQKPATPAAPGEGKPPVHRKPKATKEHDKSRNKSLSASPGRALSPSPAASKESSVDKEITAKAVSGAVGIAIATDKSVSALEVTHKLEALRINNGDVTTHTQQHVHDKINENKENIEVNKETIERVIEVKPDDKLEIQKVVEVQKIETREVREEKREEKKELSVEKTDDSEMTASMSRRITTEEQAKAALAERRRRAREELERQAELERQRALVAAEEEAERQRAEEERQRREEEEAQDLARQQRLADEDKLRRAIEAQQQLEREEAERKIREEADRKTRLREEEEKRRAAEEAEKVRKEEAEKEERERLARKQRVEAIMARTRLRKAEEDKKQQDNKQTSQPAVDPAAPAVDPAAPAVDPAAPAVEPAAPAMEPAAPVAAAPVELMLVPVAAAAIVDAVDNGNAVTTGDLLGSFTSQPEESAQASPGQILVQSNDVEVIHATNNGNLTADLLGLSQQNHTEDKIEEQSTQKQNQQPIDNAPNTNTPTAETNNGNIQHVLEPPTTNIGHISANFIQTERMSNESQKLAEVPKLLDDDFTTHNGHGTTHNHPLTLQNAI